jgi:hypothetical protein
MIASRDQLPALSQTTACQVAELHLLNTGFEDETSTDLFTGFDCAGKLELQDDNARLPDLRFRPSSSAAPISVTACFKRGNRWFVSELQRTGPCATP